jgi:hypothetical protein
MPDVSEPDSMLDIDASDEEPNTAHARPSAQISALFRGGQATERVLITELCALGHECGSAITQKISKHLEGTNSLASRSRLCLLADLSPRLHYSEDS